MNPARQGVNSPDSKDALLPWFDGSGPSAEIIISTRVRIARNLADHSFPYRSSLHERTAVYTKVAGAIRNLRPRRRDGNFTIVNFSGTSALDQNLFVEKRIASPDLLHAEGDRGVAYDGASPVSVMINEKDHVRLQCLCSGCQPLDAWKSADRLDEELGRVLNFAYHSRKGFLTSCPANSGTGLRVSYLLHMPGLILTKSVDAVLQGASQMGIATRSFFGEHSAVVGSFFQLSNQAGMGANENDFLASTQRTVLEVLGCEQEARERLIKDATIELTDKIYRAYGILLQARTLSIAEYLNLTSALRLGIDCGIFAECSSLDLNRALLMVMPAHLQKQTGKNLDETECSVLRAERVRELLFKKKRVRGRNSSR
jgi:protein arginine kinase